MLTQALSAGFKLVIVAETCSDPKDDVASCLLRQLPPDVAAAARVYSTSMARQPLLQDDDSAAVAAGDGSSGSSSLEASLSAAATRVKQKGAQEFVERLSAALAGKDAAVQVQIDPLLQQSGRTTWDPGVCWLVCVMRGVLCCACGL